MTEEEMFALPFDEYIRYRTEFAIERAKTSGVIDIDYAFLCPYFKRFGLGIIGLRK
jgi:hypothetical protein